MSSDALIKFYDTHAQGSHLDECQRFYVYQDKDGTPFEVFKKLINALYYAIPIESWMADDFSAAYIAANKERNNRNIRLSDDLEYVGYRYEVTCIKNWEGTARIICGMDPMECLRIKAVSVRGGKDNNEIIFEGTMYEFNQHIMSKE